MTTHFPVITGLGIVTAAGCGVDEVWHAIRAGQSGLKPLTLFQSPRYGQIPAGEIRDDLIALGAPSRGSRSDQLGWLAAREAIAASKINTSGDASSIGVVLGSSVGGSFDSERFLTTLIKRRKMRARPTRFHECASVVELIADDFGLFGPCMAVATACSAGALAIAIAADMIMAGETDTMLAGGADSLSRMTWGGFHSLLLLDAAGCRPFDARRAGTSLGEGAGMLVLESEKSAKRRGAKILARLAGWGASCDAHHATAPHPDGKGAIAAMQSALRRAGLQPSAIDYVNAHGTGTRDNDLAESKALKSVFADHIPPFSSTKHFFGHALAASGAIEAVVCVEALQYQEIPANHGFLMPDPAIGIEPVTMFQRASLTHVMSNSFGFGGNNAALIFSAPGTVPQTRAPQPRSAAVVGLGVIGPGTITEIEIEEPLPPGKVLAHSCGTLAEAAFLTSNERRRTGRLMQMALLAARRSHLPDSSRRLAVSLGTGLGCLKDAGVFLENLISKEEREPKPSRFPNSVHNAASGQIAIDLDAYGMNSAPTMGEISFESALWLGMNQLQTGEADKALVGAVDELNKYPLAIGRRWGLWNEQIRPGEGAMVASLAGVENSATSLARVTAVRLGRYHKPFDAEREADWIIATINLKSVEVLLSGAKGWPKMDEYYSAVAVALSTHAGRSIEHRTYKQLCGEFHSASAFGFSVAVDLARRDKRGVLLYTLSPRGGKAICCVQP